MEVVGGRVVVEVVVVDVVVVVVVVGRGVTVKTVRAPLGSQSRVWITAACTP